MPDEIDDLNAAIAARAAAHHSKPPVRLDMNVVVTTIGTAAKYRRIVASLPPEATLELAQGTLSRTWLDRLGIVTDGDTFAHLRFWMQGAGSVTLVIQDGPSGRGTILVKHYADRLIGALPVIQPIVGGVPAAVNAAFALWVTAVREVMLLTDGDLPPEPPAPSAASSMLATATPPR